MTILGESKYEIRPMNDYWTPKWAVEWLLARTGNLTDKIVWEPACGAGHISEVLQESGHKVLSTDVIDHLYLHMQGTADFLSIEAIDPAIAVICTNPPYDIKGVPGVPDVTAEMFVRHAIKLMEPVGGKVYMLLRNEFDSARSRVDLFDKHPFLGKYVLTRRPSWVAEKKASPRHNYSWFAWDWGVDLPPPALYYLTEPKAAA